MIITITIYTNTTITMKPVNNDLTDNDNDNDHDDNDRVWWILYISNGGSRYSDKGGGGGGGLRASVWSKNKGGLALPLDPLLISDVNDTLSSG